MFEVLRLRLQPPPFRSLQFRPAPFFRSYPRQRGIEVGAERLHLDLPRGIAGNRIVQKRLQIAQLRPERRHLLVEQFGLALRLGARGFLFAQRLLRAA